MGTGSSGLNDLIQFLTDMEDAARELAEEFKSLGQEPSVEKAKAIAEGLDYLREKATDWPPDFPAPRPRMPLISGLCIAEPTQS